MSYRAKLTPEARLVKAVAEFEKHHGGSFTSADRKSVCEFLRLPTLYRGEHVVFRDKYEGEGDSLRLVKREVLCHSRSHAVVQKYIDELPKEERGSVRLDFIESSRTIRANI